jgi:ribosomal protein S18 acetylase RimI-like enzyme
MLVFRKAVLSDAERIAQIHAETWLAAYHNFIPVDFINNRANLESRRKLWNGLLSHEHESHFVAENEGEIVGFFSVEKARDSDLPKNTCELVAIYFTADCWHKGYGSQAMEFIITQAKRRRYGGISLWVLEKNTTAISFYRKFGFAFDGKTNVLQLGNPTTECRCELPITDETVE